MARAVSYACFLALAALLMVGCGSTPPYVYRFVPGQTAVLTPRGAMVPVSAPDAVKHAVAAGNRISGRPYIYGGGHRSFESRGYDCSGTASYVLHGAGLISTPMTSGEFQNYGAAGPGKWITIYAKRGHVFTVVAGLRMDTGWNGEREGPRWSTMGRPAKGYVMRHPRGL